MSGELNMEHFKSFMECSICLERFDNPKQLKCYHNFCKKCLEDILVFKEDGSATITCPMRCSGLTVIGVDEMINDMSASYELKGMVEVFKREDKQLNSQIPKCMYDKNCTKDVAVYCCEGMMCKSCYLNHKKTDGDHQHNLNLSFNKRENKLKVLCDEHFSDCTHLCIDNKLLCAYCLHRDENHKKHAKNTITADVELLREALVNDLNEKENVNRFVKITEEDILLSKKKFGDILQMRKEECFLRYTDFLNEQEELLKCQIESICDNHMKQYPDIVPEYYQGKLRKHDVELALQKEQILNKIFTSENKRSLNCEIISLSDGLDFLSEYPLGDIQVTVGENVLVTNPPVSTIRTNLKTKKKKNNVILASATKDVKPKFMEHSGTDRKSVIVGRTSENKKQKRNYDDRHKKPLLKQSVSIQHTSHTSAQNIFDDNTQSTFGSSSSLNFFGDTQQQSLKSKISSGFNFGIKAATTAPNGGFSFGRNATRTVLGQSNNIFGNTTNTTGIFGATKPAENLFGQQQKSATGFDISASLSQCPTMPNGAAASTVIGFPPRQPFDTPNTAAGGGFTIGSGTSNPPPTRQTQGARRRLRR